jgi:hypothetical protein
MAVGVAIFTTVASAVGLTQDTAGRAVPHLAAYHLALLAASVIALTAAAVAQFVDDRAAAPTMVRPNASRRDTTAAAHAMSAGCHHPAAGRRTGLVPGGEAPRRGLQEASEVPGASRET